MQPKLKHTQEKLEFWREHLARLAASGMSQAEYCRTHDLKWFQLHYWRKKIQRNQEPSGGRLRLVPIQPAGLDHGSATRRPGPNPIRVFFDGFTVEVNDGFKLETLEKLIKALKSSRC